MEFFDNPEAIKKHLKNESIKITDHQLLYVCWQIAYQLARIAVSLEGKEKIA